MTAAGDNENWWLSAFGKGQLVRDAQVDAYQLPVVARLPIGAITTKELRPYWNGLSTKTGTFALYPVSLWVIDIKALARRHHTIVGH